MPSRTEPTYRPQPRPSKGMTDTAKAAPAAVPGCPTAPVSNGSQRPVSGAQSQTLGAESTRPQEGSKRPQNGVYPSPGTGPIRAEKTAEKTGSKPASETTLNPASETPKKQCLGTTEIGLEISPVSHPSKSPNRSTETSPNRPSDRPDATPGADGWRALESAISEPRIGASAPLENRPRTGALSPAACPAIRRSTRLESRSATPLATLLEAHRQGAEAAPATPVANADTMPLRSAQPAEKSSLEASSETPASHAVSIARNASEVPENPGADRCQATPKALKGLKNPADSLWGPLFPSFQDRAVHNGHAAVAATVPSPACRGGIFYQVSPGKKRAPTWHPCRRGRHRRRKTALISPPLTWHKLSRALSWNFQYVVPACAMLKP